MVRLAAECACGHKATIRFDLLHLVHLGVGRDIVGGAIVLLASEPNFFAVDGFDRSRAPQWSSRANSKYTASMLRAGSSLGA